MSDSRDSSQKRKSKSKARSSSEKRASSLKRPSSGAKGLKTLTLETDYELDLSKSMNISSPASQHTDPRVFSCMHTAHMIIFVPTVNYCC